MGKREKQKLKFDWDEVSDEEERDSTNKKRWESVADVSSSDGDDEANDDLSLKIVEKALLMRAAKLAPDNVVVSGEPIGSVEPPALRASQEAEAAGAYSETKKASKRVRKKKIKKMKIEDQAVVVEQEEKVEAAVNDVDLSEAKQQLNNVEIADNLVLRKLLRGPRYFDPPNSSWGTCFKCGEEGHASVNCTVAKQRKPCFVCGSLEHNARRCRKGQDCFICKKGGHHAKDCPEKHKGSLLKSQICLKCGNYGHDMFSCRNDYSANDLKEIQCYVCKRFGHLCCVKYADTSSREVSCYKCGQLGHTGMACGSLHGGEATDFGSPRLCYKCGEGGHIARECTSSANAHTRFGELSKYSTPILKSHKEKRDYTGFKSAPHDLNKARKWKQTQYEESDPMTPQKAKYRGGWIMDDPGDFSSRKGTNNSWNSPATPYTGGHMNSNWTAGGHASSTRSSKKVWNVSGSPMSQGSFQHRYSAPRISNPNPSADGFRRNHDWW